MTPSVKVEPIHPDQRHIAARDDHHVHLQQTSQIELGLLVAQTVPLTITVNKYLPVRANPPLPTKYHSGELTEDLS